MLTTDLRNGRRSCRSRRWGAVGLKEHRCQAQREHWRTSYQAMSDGSGKQSLDTLCKAASSGPTHTCLSSAGHSPSPEALWWALSLVSWTQESDTTLQTPQPPASLALLSPLDLSLALMFLHCQHITSFCKICILSAQLMDPKGS
jgi:hypothetical protein